MEKRRKVLERSRLKKEKKESKKEKIQYVKNDDEKQLEDYDPEDLATNLALAKKMLRKRNLEYITNSTYNKYAYNSDDEDLPDWFMDEEKKHRHVCLPITKEEVEN